MKQYTLPVHIRFFDIDMNNHVNNSAYFTYMENARTELLLKDFMNFKAQGDTFVVSEVSCKYIQPIRLENKVICKFSFEPAGATYFHIHFQFICEESGVLFAEGYNKMVFIHEASNRPKRIPNEFLETYVL